MSSVSSAGPSMDRDAPQTNPLSGRAQAPVIVAVAVVLFWLGLVAFYTRGNDFPFYYHTDEPSKVEQLLAGKRNFFHPQLLLLGAETLWRAGGLPKTPQGCVLAGRWTSALLAATAVILLALLAGRLGGLTAGGAAALLAGSHPMLFELAHYMKEDCAWLCGLSAMLLAATGLERRRTVGAAAWLGAASGLAASGKYIGVVTLAAAALFIAAPAPAPTASPSPTPCPNRRRLWGALLAGFVLSFALINWLILIHPVNALTGLREELGRMSEIAEEQSARIQWRYIHKLIKFTWPAPLVPALGFIGWMAWRTFRHRQRRAVEWFCVGFALVFLAVVLVTPRIKERYLLPVVEIGCVLAALGIGQVGAWVSARRGNRAAWGTAALAALLTAGTQAPDLLACWRGFHADSRRELAAFLRTGKAPADALIAHDWRVALTRSRHAALSPAYDFPQPTVESTRFLADLGTLEDFQRRGVRYFVVTNEDYGNILNAPDVPRIAALKAANQAFYGGLFKRGKLLWQMPRGRLPYLQPDLSVYYLKDETLGIK